MKFGQSMPAGKRVREQIADALRENGWRLDDAGRFTPPSGHKVTKAERGMLEQIGQGESELA